MTHTDQTELLSTHPFRRTAKKRERAIQGMLNDLRAIEAVISSYQDDDKERVPESDRITALGIADALEKFKVPDWAKGARVRKAGPFNWAVEATAWKGH